MTIAVMAGLWVLVAVLAVLAHAKHGYPALQESGRFARESAKSLAPRLIFALLAASFLAQIVPPAWIASVLGHDSGMLGILLASILGGLLPGGPMTSFPIAVFMWQYGAGVPQMVALLAGWSVFAVHRLIAYELPMMGWRFTLIRVASSAVLPPLAGLLAAAAMALIGSSAVEMLAPPH